MRLSEWVGVVLWRLAWAILVRTFFVADEYFQGPEVVHWLLWGRGVLSWEWLGPHPLRSSLFPLFLSLFSPPWWWSLWGPRLAAVLVAVVGDWSVYRLSLFWFRGNLSVARMSLLLHLSSWASIYCFARPLSNAAEASLASAILLAIALKRLNIAALLMAVSFAIRPLSALPWLLWGLLWAGPRTAVRLVPAGLLGVLAVAVLDRWFFGFWTFPAWNFLVFNSSSASHYGSHPWYWYATSGLPTLGLSFVPLFVWRWWDLVSKTTRKKRTDDTPPQWPMTIFEFILPAVYSCIPHKEFRFLLPTLSLQLLFAGPRALKLPRTLLFLLIALQLGAASYFSLVHQQGPIAVTDHLREHRAALHLNASSHLCYMAPCHSIPAFARIHYPVHLHTLECDPPRDGSAGRHTESDAFFQDAEHWVPVKLSEWQCDLVVAFEPLFPILEKRGLPKVFESAHAHFPSDSRHGTRIGIFGVANHHLGG